MKRGETTLLITMLISVTQKSYNLIYWAELHDDTWWNSFTNHYANVRRKILRPSQWQHLGTPLMQPKFERVFNNIKNTYKYSSRSILSQVLVVTQVFKSTYHHWYNIDLFIRTCWGRKICWKCHQVLMVLILIPLWWHKNGRWKGK